MGEGRTHKLMIDGLDGGLREQGFETFREVATCPGRKTGYVDLLVNIEGLDWLAIEAERSVLRAENDVQKAAVLNAHLWIVVPTSKLRTAVQARLRSPKLRKQKSITVLSYPAALQQVVNYIPILFRAIGEAKSRGQKS